MSTIPLCETLFLYLQSQGSEKSVTPPSLLIIIFYNTQLINQPKVKVKGQKLNNGPYLKSHFIQTAYLVQRHNKFNDLCDNVRAQTNLQTMGKKTKNVVYVECTTKYIEEHW